MSNTLFFYYCCEDCYSDWWQGSNCERAMAQKTLTIYTGTWYCRRLTLYCTVSSTTVEMVDRGGDEKWTSSIAVFIRGTEHVKFYIGTWECHGRTLYVSTTDVEMLVKFVTLTDDRVKRRVETWHRSHLLLNRYLRVTQPRTLTLAYFTLSSPDVEMVVTMRDDRVQTLCQVLAQDINYLHEDREPHVRSKQVFYCFTTIQRNVFYDICNHVNNLYIVTVKESSFNVYSFILNGILKYR